VCLAALMTIPTWPAKLLDHLDAAWKRDGIIDSLIGRELHKDRGSPTIHKSGALMRTVGLVFTAPLLPGNVDEHHALVTSEDPCCRPSAQMRRSASTNVHQGVMLVNIAREQRSKWNTSPTVLI